jgi:hypothetical protein
MSHPLSDKRVVERYFLVDEIITIHVDDINIARSDVIVRMKKKSISMSEKRSLRTFYFIDSRPRTKKLC